MTYLWYNISVYQLNNNMRNAQHPLPNWLKVLSKFRKANFKWKAGASKIFCGVEVIVNIYMQLYVYAVICICSYMYMQLYVYAVICICSYMYYAVIGSIQNIMQLSVNHASLGSCHVTSYHSLSYFIY